MKQTRRYSRFGSKYILQNLILFVPLVILFAIAWLRWPTTDAIFWICLILFCLGVIGGLFWDRYRLRRFRCPKCGRLIPKPTIPVPIEHEPINYYCPDCDIEWETSLFWPSSSE
ncbi:MAG: hypothetical protein ACYS9T_03535 [Planctomycetota bacterium]